MKGGGRWLRVPTLVMLLILCIECNGVTPKVIHEVHKRFMWFDNLTHLKFCVSAIGCKYILILSINVMDDYLLLSSCIRKCNKSNFRLIYVCTYLY